MGLPFAVPALVARIHVSRHDDRMRVTLSGRLRPSDMGRLEHACAPALVHDPVALDIDISGASSVDRSTTAVLQKMAERGARIIPFLPHLSSDSSA